MSKILIFRFSALGDVAMTVPVIYSLAISFPTLEITILSRASFQPLFVNLPHNVKFISADFESKYKGIFGLNKLFRELKSENFDYVADFHNVLRTSYLTWLFKLNGISTAKIDKGRAEKKNLTRKNNKIFAPLKSNFIRYQEVLAKLGFEFEVKFHSLFPLESKDLKPIILSKFASTNKKFVGIAPFAKHQGKIYPIELQEEVIAHFAKDSRIQLFIFGGGKQEKLIVDAWIQKYPSVQSMIGKLKFNEELLLINELDLMFSMDSANMHLAALTNTKTLTLWGATHPFAGFVAWNQLPENIIELNLACRPCSVYGNKVCFRKDYACLNEIKPQHIISKIEQFLF